MITADQLVAHAVGDYVLQSDWMARNKGENTVAAATHAIAYVLPFLFLTRSPAALAVIVIVHFVIDRWSLARYLVWLKNRPWPGSKSWAECCRTGFPEDTPPWMASMLLIIVDNLLHVLSNGLVLRYLG